MSVPGLAAIVGLGIWFLLSVGYAWNFPGVRRGVKALARFRVFGTWSMFAAGEGRKGAYGVAFRDIFGSDATAPWTTLAAGHHWSWHVFLLDSRRVLADAIHTTGRDLHRCLQQSATPAMAGQIAFAQERLCHHVRRLEPLAPGFRREIRVVKHLARGDVPEHIVICQFSDCHDLER